MNQSDLIHQLTKNLKPVSPQKSFMHRFFVLLFTSLIFIFVGICYWYFKKQEFHIPSGRSFVELILLTLAALTSLVYATQSASPHTAIAKVLRSPLISLVLWLGLLIFAFIGLYLVNQDESLIALKYNTWLCPIVIFSIAIPLFVTSVFYISKGSVLFAKPMFTYISILSLSCGALGLSFICPWADPLHELIWHVLPVVVSCYLLTLGALFFLNMKSLLSRISQRL
jgi:Negative regulator of sigma F